MATKREERERRQAEAKRNDFSPLVRAHIRARDGERCVLCGKPGREVHHIKPRAEGGMGTADNGVCLDPACHRLAHQSAQTARRLVRYRERVLLAYYGLRDPREYVWLDPLEEGVCRCGGALGEGGCAEDCGIVVWKEEDGGGSLDAE